MAQYPYNQNQVTVVANGNRIDGLAEGQSIVVRTKGGEVQITEGTDGPGLNVATEQGGEVEITVREGSSANARLQALRRQQQVDSQGVPVVLFSGVRALWTLDNALISVPGELSTGDKKQGQIKYTFVGTRLTPSNQPQ